MSARPLESLLQAIAGSDALARGCVNVLGFEAIRRSIGERWHARREQVWDHIQKTVEGRLSPADTVVRIGEVEFLVFFAVESGPVAQTVCLRLLQEILVHYLGAFEMADLTIKTVTAVHGSALSCVDLDPSAILQATDPNAPARRASLEDAERKSAANALPPVAKVRDFDLHFQLEDIVSLRHDALAGGRIRRLVMQDGAGAPLTRQELASLDTTSLAAIDMQTVTFATALLQGQSSFAYPSLLLPAALQTFGHSASRARYLQMLRALPPEGRRRLSVELINIDEGTPSGRIADTVSALRGVCRGVAAFTVPTARAMCVLRNHQMMAVMVNTQQLAPAGVSREPAIARFAEAAKGVAPVTGLYGDLLPGELIAAREAGIIYWINPLERIGRQAAA